MHTHTDTLNRDPYRRSFSVPKWSRAVRVTDEPRLFRRLPEFATWTKDRHYQMALEYLAIAGATRRMYQDAIDLACELYGNGTGILISGIYRDHFPEPMKVSLRVLARELSESHDRSLAHWLASGRRVHTWRDARDRSGV